MSAPRLLVLDLGLGLVAALISKSLSEQGAHVVRIEPPGGDPFHDIYPAHRVLRSYSELAPEDQFEVLLARADVCIVGGEDYPDLTWKFDTSVLSRSNRKLVVLDVSAHLSADTRAVDLLVQARTGLSFEQFSDRPVCFAVALPTYGAALLGLLGIWAALYERTRSGLGQIVSTSMQQGAALFWSPFWMMAERPDATFNTITPKDVRHLIFQCADGGYIQFAMGVPGAVSKVYEVLGIDVDVDASDRGNPRPGSTIDQYFGDRTLIAPYISKWLRSDLLVALHKAGIAAEAVLPPGECWDDPQVAANELIRSTPEGWRHVGAPIDIEDRGAVPGARIPMGRPMTGSTPLAGVRIVDLGNFVAGPFAARLLASLGADVVKVDPPGGAATISGYRTVYASNCGKRSLCVDAKTPEGREIVMRLCAAADVVHHNFRVGVVERLGLDASYLRQSNPGLIVARTTAYGCAGPKAANPGFDMVMQALCGHEIRAGGAGNPPLWYRSPFVDFATGALGAIAILVALVKREIEGCAVDAQVSLLGTALFLMSELVQTPAGKFVGAMALDAGRSGFHPAESLYRARDGWIAIAARGEAMAQRLAMALKLNLPPRPQWDNAERAALAARIRNVGCTELLALLEKANVWAERCVEDGWAALCGDGAARQRRLVVDVADSQYGQVSGCLGAFINFSRSASSPSAPRAAPRLGQHSDELLQEHGYSIDAIARLRERRAVG